MARMTNLEKALKTLLVQIHVTYGHLPKRVNHESGFMLSFYYRTDHGYIAPILVNSAGDASVPTTKVYRPLLSIRSISDEIRELDLQYFVTRGRITTVGVLDNLDGEQGLWWLMVITAINSEFTQTEQSLGAQRLVEGGRIMADRAITFGADAEDHGQESRRLLARDMGRDSHG